MSHITNYLPTDFVHQIPYFDQFSYLFGFLLAMLPYPIPDESWIIPIASVSSDRLQSLFVLYVISFTGELITHTIIFTVAKKHIHRLTRKKRSEMNSKSGWHRYGILNFLWLPLASSVPFTFYLTDGFLLFLAHEKANYLRILPFLVVGIIVRVLVGMYLVWGIVIL